MSEHRFTLDDTGTDMAPAAVRPSRYPHRLRYEKPVAAARTGPEGQTPHALSDLTVVTCACGLATPPLPNDDARLAYERHRNEIRDELAGVPAP
ncbi:hypothetical protein DEJ51_34095 [Streptomyces venezuelae]|uniref:Uncharacterized protein n=1 Tax=Streptomyces venezuelae TaxID=54571 RepID=A0A5P2E0W5_STRVZ|nr:hypothetical protein [Streptomyces venezuelae]QES58539.1 hypothetical protein DEJ51_34095 [Streptomyces venezuelae]